MDDLRRRFASLDRVPAPDLWDAIERRAMAPEPVKRVTRVATPVAVRSPRSPERSLALYLVAAAVLLALVVGAVAVGSGLVRQPAIVVRDASLPPEATVAPSATALASPTSTASHRWITGQELMDALSAEYGYEWSPNDSTGVRAFESGPVRVSAPVNGRAVVTVGGAVVDIAEVELHAGRVAQALAPDVAPWIMDAIAQGLDAFAQGLDEGDPLVTEFPTLRSRVSTTLTAAGGQVGVTVVDEDVLEDLVWVDFAPDAPPTRVLEPGGKGIVLYPVHDRQGDRIWAVDPDGTDAGLFVPSPRTPYGVGDVLGWSADGSRLFYGAGGGLFAVDADGSPAFRVGALRDNPLCPVVVPDDCQANDEHISISPDGTRLAYSLQESSESDNNSIAVLDVASGRVTRLDSTRGDQPSWSPDGESLVFGCPGIRPGTDGICRVNVDGSGLRQLLPAIAGDASDPLWSPDGSRILFKVDGGGRAELFTIGSDGADLRSLTSDGLPDLAHWTRDGRIVFIRRDREAAGGTTDVRDVRIMDAGGGNLATFDTTISAQTAAGCLVCPVFDEQGQIRHRLWQPMPDGQP